MKLVATALITAAVCFGLTATTGFASHNRYGSHATVQKWPLRPTYTLHRGQSIYIASLDLFCSYQPAPEGKLLNCTRASVRNVDSVYPAGVVVSPTQIIISGPTLHGKIAFVNRNP